MYRANKTNEDVLYILEHLRCEDLHEAIALNGENWKEKLYKKIMNSKSYVMLGKSKKDNKPVCMGGFEQSEDNTTASAWLLCTEEIVKHAVCILRELKTEVKKADEKYWLTYNIIYKENNFAKRWLSSLGYKFDCPKPEGFCMPEGFEFFYRIRPIKGLGE